MLGEQAAKDSVGNGRRRFHHRKSASDTLAFAASAFFNELPSPIAQPCAVTSTAGPAANRSTEDGGAETQPSSYTFRMGFGPSDVLEVLKDMDEDELEFDVDDLCVDDLDVEGEEDVVVCDVGDADPDADADVGLDVDVRGIPSHVATTADAEATLGLSAAPARPATVATLSAAATAALEQPTPSLSRQPQQHQQDLHLCSSAADSRLGSSPCGGAGGGGGGYTSGGSNGRRRQSASCAAPGAPSAAPGAGGARSSRHVRHPSDPSVWPAAPVLVDKPLSEFAGQTRANALDPSQLDPKRAKRIIANRQSAHRSRMKKLQVIQDLEQQVTAAKSVTDSSRQQVAAAAARRRELLLAALEAHCQLEGLRREAAAAAAVQAALVSELHSLGAAAAQGTSVCPEHEVHTHAYAHVQVHGHVAAAAAVPAAAVAAEVTSWGGDNATGGGGGVAAETVMVDGGVPAVEGGGVPAAVGSGDVGTPPPPSPLGLAGPERPLGGSAAVTLGSTAAPLPAAVVGASAITIVPGLPDVLFSDSSAPPSSSRSAGPHLTNSWRQLSSSSGRSETGVTSASRLVPGLAPTCGAGTLDPSESSLPPTAAANMCSGNPGGSIPAGAAGAGGGGGTALMIGAGLCTAGVKTEFQQEQWRQQQQEEQQQAQHPAATAAAAMSGLHPLIPGGFFHGSHPHPSSGPALLATASGPAHAASAAVAGTDGPVSTAGVTQASPHLPAGLSTGSSAAASSALCFTTQPTPTAQHMPVAVPFSGGAAGDMHPHGHVFFEAQAPQGGPQDPVQPPPPPHGGRVPSRPVHRRHFSAGCAVEQRSPLAQLWSGGVRGGCFGESLLGTAPLAVAGPLPTSAAPFPVVPACGSRTPSFTSTTNPSIITTITSASAGGAGAGAGAADTEMAPAGGDPVAADPLQLRMRLSASSAHQLAPPLFTASAAGPWQGPGYSCGNSKAGLHGLELSAVLGPAAADGSGLATGVGGDGSPMALDGGPADSLMPDSPNVEDFLVKEEVGTGVGSTAGGPCCMAQGV
ncbi:hypothetical protein Vretimale_14991 [Volvox reticuliferus]|uniref:BZIP domain-containing protein n=1 Tax=Volvox reticuliferus TaxID=1737510 RepID=A0A8J4LVA0_9CHLO|nr:hypothetical protein Vretimale_14991 [Volvox reticuliferus]